MKKETMLELLNKLNSEGMLYFFLASMISADSTRSVADCEHSIEILKATKESAPESELTEEQKAYVDKFCDKGVDICEAQKRALENIN